MENSPVFSPFFPGFPGRHGVILRPRRRPWLFAPAIEQRPADARGQRAALHRRGAAAAEGAVATPREEGLGNHLLGTSEIPKLGGPILCQTNLGQLYTSIFLRDIATKYVDR